MSDQLQAENQRLNRVALALEGQRNQALTQGALLEANLRELSEKFQALTTEFEEFKKKQESRPAKKKGA